MQVLALMRGAAAFEGMEGSSSEDEDDQPRSKSTVRPALWRATACQLVCNSYILKRPLGLQRPFAAFG